jgi:glutamate decarboxylase
MGFKLMSQGGGKGLPLVAFRIDPKNPKHYDEFAIAHVLRERGWIVPAYTMAPNAGHIKMLRVVVREDFTRSRCNALLADFKLALETLNKVSPEHVEQQAKVNASLKTNSAQATHSHDAYTDEQVCYLSS